MSLFPDDAKEVRIHERSKELQASVGKVVVIHTTVGAFRGKLELVTESVVVMGIGHQLYTIDFHTIEEISQK